MGRRGEEVKALAREALIKALDGAGYTWELVDKLTTDDALLPDLIDAIGADRLLKAMLTERKRALAQQAAIDAFAATEDEGMDEDLRAAADAALTALGAGDE